ncbi:glutamate-5-semialdehyde dehydrogenase [Rahnella inusitata]|uniref:glutamate-5-semialdehyde dehydrogenase n=1 Tax=Rahnella inusitata TaxID=58169 RepID=UPI0039B0F4CB
MLNEMGKAAKAASWQLATLSTAQKNRALMLMADMLEANSQSIILANEFDMSTARESGMSEALLDRLLLTPARLSAIASDVRDVCRLSDPVGQVIDGSLQDSGLRLERRRVPLGVIGVIYEARPNVTIDVASLCLKTGNAVILRGGKETHHTNQATVKVIQQALEECGLPKAAVQAIDSPDRALVAELLRLDKYVDMLIPRGGAALHKLCREQSTIPVITGGIGVCHTFVDESVDFDKALTVIESAKIQRPSACNSLETVLVHQAIAARFLPELSDRMHRAGVTLHASESAMQHLQSGPASVLAVTEEDYQDEWLSLDLNVTVVAGLDAAVAHIRTYGTEHSDAILTRSISSADRFVREVDSSAVYVNASTRFTDGGQFGLGAEVAVSTQKLHARGPMGLEALTTYKWIGYGDDLVRP